MKNLKQKLKAAQEAYAAKSAERDALLSKEDPSIDDLSKAKSLNVELKTLREGEEGKPEGSIVWLKGLVDESEAELKFNNDPVIDLQAGGDNSQNARVLGVVNTDEAMFLHTNRLGQVEIENKGKSGLIDLTKLNTFREKKYEDAFAAYVRCAGDLGRLDSIHVKTLEEGTDGAGGYFVPDAWVNHMIMRTAAPTRVNSRVTQITIAGDSIMYPKVVYSADDIYTTGIRCTLTGERPSSSTVHRVTDPIFGQTRLNVGTYMMSLPITQDLIEDANFPLMSWCTERFRETIDLLYDDQLLNGTGVGVRPHGIMRNPGGTDEVGVHLSSTNDLLDAVQLRKAPFKVPEQYINDNTGWVFNRANTGAAIATMQDSTNRFMFMEGQTFPGLVGRTPDQLAGYPIMYSAFMADQGNNKFPALFGDLRGAVKVNRVGFSIRVLTERYAEDNYVVLLGRLRWGGGVIEPFRMIALKSDAS